MGLMQFLTPRRELLTQQAIDRAYIAGMDEIPWPARFVGTEKGLVIDRPMGDSGNLYIPWKVDGHPEVVLSTASLMERQEPYLLEVELARGTLNRVRNHVAAWDTIGVEIGDDDKRMIHEATVHLSNAVVQQDDAAKACEVARSALIVAVQLTRSLGVSHTQKTLATRCETTSKLTTLFGADLGRTPLDDAKAEDFLKAFNSAIVPFAWQQIEAQESTQDWALTDKQVEWCHLHNLRIASGPLLKFDRTGFPDWLYLWEEDDEQVLGFMAEHVKNVVNRYKGRVHVWQCAASMNVSEVLSLSTDQQLRAAIGALEAIRKVDPRTPALVTFDQPWGEYIARREMDMPWQFADALIRSSLGMAGIGIAINMGFQSGSSLSRELLEFGRQLDRWSLLGLPLLVTISVPGGQGEDSQAQIANTSVPDGWTPEQQAEWIRDYVPMLLSKPSVQAVLWNNLRDDEPHDLAHSGLFNTAGQPKPAIAELQKIRQQFVV